MSDDATAGSSLLQTHAEKVHREHNQHHIHNALHRRQAVVTSVGIVTTTVSVVRQIEVDTFGSTIAILTITPIAGDAKTPTPTPVVAPAAPLTTSANLPLHVATSTGGAIAVPVTYTPQSLPSSHTTALSLSSKSGKSANSTIPTGLSSSLAHASNLISNLTLSSTLTALKSRPESSQQTTLFLATSTIPGYLSSSPLAVTATTDAAGYPFAGGRGTTGASSPASTSDAAGTGGGSSNSTPATPVVVGGVVGGIAGVAFIVLVLLFIVRWKKRNRGILSLGRSDGSSTGAITSRDGGDLPQGGMTERSIPFAIPTALAALTGRNKRASHAQSVSSTAGSQRGFYRVSGRKLPSVLQSGGDGYGGGLDDMPTFNNPDTLSGTSFYRDSQGFHGGQSIATETRDSGIPIMRPSPARTPVHQQGPFAPPPLQSPFETPPPPPRIRPDGLGRSHPSQDGSHGSRFTEEIV